MKISPIMLATTSVNITMNLEYGITMKTPHFLEPLKPMMAHLKEPGGQNPVTHTLSSSILIKKRMKLTCMLHQMKVMPVAGYMTLDILLIVLKDFSVRLMALRLVLRACSVLLILKQILMRKLLAKTSMMAL